MNKRPPPAGPSEVVGVVKVYVMSLLSGLTIRLGKTQPYSQSTISSRLKKLFQRGKALRHGRLRSQVRRTNRVGGDALTYQQPVR